MPASHFSSPDLHGNCVPLTLLQNLGIKILIEKKAFAKHKVTDLSPFIQITLISNNYGQRCALRRTPSSTWRWRDPLFWRGGAGRRAGSPAGSTRRPRLPRPRPPSGLARQPCALRRPHGFLPMPGAHRRGTALSIAHRFGIYAVLN